MSRILKMPGAYIPSLLRKLRGGALLLAALQILPDTQWHGINRAHRLSRFSEADDLKVRSYFKPVDHQILLRGATKMPSAI